MASMVVTLDTSQFDMLSENDAEFKNMAYMLVTLDTSHLERSPSKYGTKASMRFMSVTLDMSQFEISLLNLFAPGRGLSSSWTNNFVNSVTDERSQVPIGPWGPSLQPLGSTRHSLMAACSSALDLGLHPVVFFLVFAVRVRFKVWDRARVRVSLRDRARAHSVEPTLLRV